MKKIIFALVFSFIFLPSFVFAQSWEISDFHSDIVIDKYAEANITETISVEFFDERRGIFREVPTLYKDENGNTTELEITFLSVVDEKGNSYQFETANEYGYERIRIGDPDLYLTGPYKYIISYSVKGAVSYYQEQDEFFWDVSGNDWEVTIPKSSVSVTLPEFDGEISTKCYTGIYGSVFQDCELSINQSTVTATADDYLSIVVGFPKGVVMQPATISDVVYIEKEPTPLQQLLSRLRPYYGLGFPLITILFMFLMWNRYGKDPKKRSSLVVEYDSPDDTTPAEMGFLYYQKFKQNFLSAELVYFASEGYIKIRQEKEDDEYTLIKQKSFDDLSEPEQKLLNELFLNKTEVKLSDIPSDFYKTVNNYKKEVYKEMKRLKYYDTDPRKVRGLYQGWAGFFFFVFAFSVGISSTFGLGMIISGIIVFIFSFIMPKRTERGTLAYEHTLGFFEYLDKAESRRVKWEEQQHLFFDYLPYAMIFGIADKWAKVFKDMFNEPPDWYEGNIRNFNSVNFVNSVNAMSASALSHMSPPRSSSSSSYSSGSSGFSGGGFSGGGFGGGGGGSW